ncbi:MAG: peptidoglycan DD-metalloendopeptidase family protein [Trichlorobacter sp.]
MAMNLPDLNSRRFSQWLLALLVLVCLGGVALMVSGGSSRTPDDSVAGKNRQQTIRGTIQPGETLSSLVSDLLSVQQIHEVAQQCRQVYPLNQIAVGQPYELTLERGAFQRFAYDIDADKQLIIARDGDEFSVIRIPIDYAVKQAVVQGTISSSLFQAVLDAGGGEGLAMQLADVFAWDINFFLDIQPGDSFKAVIEKRYRNGQPAGSGRLLAADFTVQGQTYQAFYFKDGDRTPGYYDQDGRNLRKVFLKAPLSYRRISSGFSMRRLHPVTRKVKAHPAIDYAAPTGTPIHTVGSGVVSVAAYNRGNGKYVKVRHPGGWVTMYNHLSRFGKSIRKGSKVGQGQLIGYVGNTGLSTGSHLDFRMYRNGRAVNPLKIKSPSARPVSKANLLAFKALVAERIASMGIQPSAHTSV